MTLSTRVAVEPARGARRLEVFAVAGGAGLATATVVARASLDLQADRITPIAVAVLVAVLCGTLVAWRHSRRRDREASRPVVLAIDASDEVWIEDTRRGHDETPARLHASSTVWPGFAVLRFDRPTRASLTAPSTAPIAPFACPIVDAELREDDARRLRRWLLWLARGGARPDSANDRPSR